jgi:hypothetical protein
VDPDRVLSPSEFVLMRRQPLTPEKYQKVCRTPLKIECDFVLGVSITRFLAIRPGDSLPLNPKNYHYWHTKTQKVVKVALKDVRNAQFLNDARGFRL